MELFLDALKCSYSLKTPRKISKQGFFFHGINFKFQYGQLFWGLPAKYCPCFLFCNNKTHVATFIFLTKFSFKLTSSSKWLIGSIGVQLSVGFSCNEFHFLLHKRLPCCSVCNIPSGTGIDKNPFQSNTSELDVYGGNSHFCCMNCFQSTMPDFQQLRWT